MKVPMWLWFIGGLALSSLVTASTQSMTAASRAGEAVREVRALKSEIAKLRSDLEHLP